jgi:hypothetical protein
VPIAVIGRGAKLFGQGLRTELTRDEVDRTLMEGFFPESRHEEMPRARTRAALTQLGLPYAADPGVTRHLAAFLTRQTTATERLEGFRGTRGAFLHPTRVLFNGGVMKADPLRRRVLDVLESWLAADGGLPARELGGADKDLAVARGAVAYGLARRGRGVRIRGGTARAYYVGIESAAPAVPGVEPEVVALCVAPFGMEEGTEQRIDGTELGAVVGEPVQFRFFGSSTRRDDPTGTQVERPTEVLTELAPIAVTLPAGRHPAGSVVAVRLASRVTELGVLELVATSADSDEEWRVELNAREG